MTRAMGQYAIMTQHPQILVTSCMRNEGPYVIDWLAHMIGAGISDFRLYTNDCTDGTDKMLDLLQDAGIVTHIRHSPEPGESVQWHGFRDAWKSDQRKAADWIMACDVDEYPNIKLGQGTFNDLLDAVPDGTDGIVLPWRLFGNNDLHEFDDQPVTERFTRSMTPNCVYPVGATFFKTLLRCDGPFNQLGVHRPSQKAPDKARIPNWVDGSLKSLPAAFARNSGRLSLFGTGAGRDLVEMNHYSLRSCAEYLVKRSRGLPNHRDRQIDLTYWVQRNFNTVDNTSIALMGPATAHAKERLLQISGLTALHTASKDRHHAILEQTLSDPIGYDVLSHIVLAGSTHELAHSDAERLYQLFTGLGHTQ